MGDVAPKTSQLPGGRDQSVPEVGMPFQELATSHDGECTVPATEVFPRRAFKRLVYA